MKTGKLWAVIMLLGFLAVSCNQDSIFFTISKETAPKKPRIEGSPTNMVVFTRNKVPIMYVASGRLHWYVNSANGPQWDLKEYAIPQPKGKITALAVAKTANGGDRLYALCGHGVNATLLYIESDGNTWIPITNGAAAYPVIQSIYTDPESTQLFAGAGKNNQSQATYGILYLANDTLITLQEDTALLSGVVYHKNVYYLSTRGDGIFQMNNDISVQQLIDSSAIEEKDKKNNRTFMGLIKLEDIVIAVERDKGSIYQVHNGYFEQMWYTEDKKEVNTGRYATGALTLWQDPERNIKLLVAGIQGELYSTTSSQTYGYVEFNLNPNDGFKTITIRYNPGNLLSVHDNDRYRASIGKHPVNHLLQAPPEIDPAMTFFASTQADGLWSYRNRPHNGGWQWNAEE